MPMPAIPAKNTASPFSSISGSHIGLRVPDFEASKRWFVEKLDFRVIHEWPFGDLKLAYLAPANDDNFWIEILAGGTPAARPDHASLADSLNEAGYHHFCLNVKSVDETLAELRRRGVTVVGEPFDLEPISRRLGCFTDPWGNIIELSETLAASK